jgi:hypothetical protein
MNFLTNMATSAKVSLAMKGLGLSSEETKAVDSLVSSVGSHPLSIVTLGKEYTNVKQVIADGIDIVGKDNSASIDLIKRAGPWIGEPKVRDAFATLILQKIDNSDDKVELYNVIRKISELPISGFGDFEYQDTHEFISRGILGLVSHHINELPSDNQEQQLHTCPHCDEMFYSV